MAPGEAGSAVSRRATLLGSLGVCALALWPRVDATLHPGGPGHETDSSLVRHEIDPEGVVRIITQRPWVGLTFDDGPDPAFTPEVLDVLAAYGARATFFAVGRNLEAHPDIARRIVSDGHRLSNHTQDHLWLDRLGDAALTHQLEAGHDAVARYDPVGARLVRPPRGWTSATVAQRTRELGQRSVFWSACLESALHDGARSGGRSVGESLQPGDVVLAHDGGRISGPNAQDLDRTPSVEALPALLDVLRRRGLLAVPVQDLLRA
ncbi:polysaccharide deacetylase family protein [Monashia sp. NPDC004114]